MKNFAAIDFETANEQRASVCSVGIVIVREGEIVDTYYSLIRPEPEYYTYWTRVCMDWHWRIRQKLRYFPPYGRR